jgi:hypothetical protein
VLGPAFGSSIGAAVVLGLAFIACPSCGSAYGPSDCSSGCGQADAATDAAQRSPACPDKSTIGAEGECPASLVGVTCVGIGLLCGEAAYRDCTCQKGAHPEWFCGEASCPTKPGSEPGSDAASGRDAETRDSSVGDSTIHDTGVDARSDVRIVEDAATGIPDGMTGVMYGPAAGDW